MIIDIHTHAWPDKVSGKARENLEAFFKVKMVGEPTVTTLLESMDRNGIDTSVVCSVASRPDQVVAINDWAFGVRSKRLRAFASMHPAFEGWKEEIRRISREADGIKFQPEFQNFYVDDEAVFPIYEEIEKAGLPVLFHCGEELSGTMLIRSSPDRVLRVKETFPELKLIAGHFGGFRLWPEVKKYLLGKDIFLDTAFFFGHLENAQAREMILSHRPDRILFGTDFPLVDQAKDLAFLASLDISEELKQGILYKNALGLLDKKV